MRLSRSSASMEVRSRIASFARWVLDIGEGTLSCPFALGDRLNVGIRVPEKFLLTGNGPKMEALADDIYNDFVSNYASVPYLATRSVICPTNAVVEDINNLMVSKVPGSSREYLSCDGIANAVEQPSDFESLYPLEFLNSITINNFPQHRLLLKIGVPIVLLRNINQAAGLCNGTRLMVDRLGDRVIEARLMTQNSFGVFVAIPRIILNASSPKWPFMLQRRQFPVRVCYAMTINKCQGQTLQKVGVYLKDPVFTHGQLYVAVSRDDNENGLRIAIENDLANDPSVTKNIVYQEALHFI
jgi:ATP-dependent DNA helicase PIF1